MRPIPLPARFYLPLFITLAFLSACGGGPSRTDSPPGPPTGPAPSAEHVVLVVLENHSFDQVVGNPLMPFFNTLGGQFALATNYFANAHPSLPNYFMLTVGQLEAADDQFSGTVSDDNIVRALSGAGRTWKAYMESLPAQGYTGPDVLPYLKHHDPFAYFTDILNSTSQQNQIVPFTQFVTDLAAGALPNFAFVAPNVQHDGHDCPDGGSSCQDSDKLAAADSWLSANISPLIKSPAFSNVVLIITFDESQDSDVAGGGGHVATVLAGANVKRGFQSITLYQHSSTLRLILDLLGVADHPGASASAPSMFEFFQ